MEPASGTTQEYPSKLLVLPTLGTPMNTGVWASMMFALSMRVKDTSILAMVVRSISVWI